jgi:hypothetical protein
LTIQAQDDFEWKDSSRNTHSLSDLAEILRKHQEWINSGYKSGTPADLKGADLTGAELGRANLTYANLTHAKLIRSNLSDADLTGANLGRALFEPKVLPGLRAIATAENLELLTYSDNPDGLVQLRKKFEDGGFREQERKITYALKRGEVELSCEKRASRKLRDEEAARPIVSSSDSVLANCGSFVLNTMFFDWTCQYGMSPGRPLILGLLQWLLCSALYFGFMHTSGHAGLYRVYGKSMEKEQSAARRVERISFQNMARSGKARLPPSILLA